jgi:hypothetical protein
MNVRNLLNFRTPKRVKQEAEAVKIRKEAVKTHDDAQNVLSEMNKILSNGITLKIYKAMGGNHHG